MCWWLRGLGKSDRVGRSSLPGLWLLLVGPRTARLRAAFEVGRPCADRSAYIVRARYAGCRALGFLRLCLTPILAVGG